jgi:hypothetical protein
MDMEGCSLEDKPQGLPIDHAHDLDCHQRIQEKAAGKDWT